MIEVLSYLAPVAVFAAALAVLYAVGRRPRREAMTLRAVWIGWSSPPLSLFLAAWLLLVLTAIAARAFPSTALWAISLGLAGVVLIYCGWQVAANSTGWAATLVQRVWTEQGIRIPYPVQQARAFGVAMALIGGAFVALAVAGVS